jgi:hypothetical protein
MVAMTQAIDINYNIRQTKINGTNIGYKNAAPADRR